MKKLILLALAIVIPADANAEEPDRGLAGCAAIENTVNRLTCYDELAKQRNVDRPALETVSEGKWVVQTETSKIDDTTNAFMFLQSDNEFSGRYKGEQRATLNIVCREKSTHVYFQLGDHFVADIGGFGEMTVRLDKQKATTISTRESTDNGALGLWNGAGIPFVKKMFGKSVLLVRATPYNESPVTVEFAIRGIESAIAPIRKNCNW